MTGLKSWVGRMSILLLIALVLPSMFIIIQSQVEPWDRFKSHFAGFEELSQEQFYALASRHTEIPVPLVIEKNQPETEWLVRFNVEQDTVVYLSASAESAEMVFVHPLIIRQDGRLTQILPLIRSDQPDKRIWNAIELGPYKAGQHTLVLSQDRASSLSIPGSLQLSASRPGPHSTLATFIDHAPVFEIKDSTKVLDDIPLMSYATIQQKGQRYKVRHVIIFSSENGGTMPTVLMRDTARTLDIEWAMQQIFAAEGGRIQAGERVFQDRRHGTEKYIGRQQFGNRPILYITTDNNNFGDGWWHYRHLSLPRPMAQGGADSIYYAPKPMFLPPGGWWGDVLERYPELQQWSMFELAKEGCVNLQQLSSPQALSFMDELVFFGQHVHISYPSRGCGNDTLQLE